MGDTRLFIYNDLTSRFFNPYPHPAILNLEDFQAVKQMKLKVKTYPMMSFNEVKDALEPGDQLWIFHNRPGIRSYAHVVIILNETEFMHATAPDGFKDKFLLESVIKRASLDIYSDEMCFTVRSGTVDSELLCKRALLCEGIKFPYDPENANCESFVNGVYGDWGPSFQGQDLRGCFQNVIKAWSNSRLCYDREDPLDRQMKNKFKKAKCTIPECLRC